MEEYYIFIKGKKVHQENIAIAVTGNRSTSRSHYTTLDIYPKDSTPDYKDPSSFMFIIVLFITTRNYKQPKCPSTEE